MRIKSLKLSNFRCFSSLELNLDRDATLIFGTNGVGKSTVVDALAIACSVLPGVGTQTQLRESDLRLETAAAGTSFHRERVGAGSVAIEVAIDDTEWTWELRLVRGTSLERVGAWQRFQKVVQERVTDRKRRLSVLGIYPAHRSWQDRQPTGESPVGRLSGYEGALTAGSDLAELRAWWRDQDHRRASEVDTPALDAAEVAVARFLGQEDLLPRYSLEEKDVIVAIPETGARLTLRELSDGYRSMVALVADVARRMSQLNPDVGSELLTTTPGMVAIDELELHLHPHWQWEVLPRLRQTFPEVQFIVTSHAPQVLASLKQNSEVVGLSISGEVHEGAWQVVGRDSNSILGEVMGDRVRPAYYQRKLNGLFARIDDGDFAAARDILAELEEKWGDDEPNLLDARWALEVEEA